MDKKQNFHSRQTTSKGLVSESRSKNSDVAKQWPRNGKRRENTNLPNSKADLQRSNAKNNSIKNRTNVDKRPRPRGGTTSSSISISSSCTGLAQANADAPESETECFDVELNSVYSTGSKKQNLNHLLNFHYALRENDNFGVSNSLIRSGNNRQLRKSKYNKEQFLQANCQFVVKKSTDLKINTTISPDALVDWDNIEQINIQTTEEPQCPICLYPPVAAKLTRCGHVYCWACVLHYLALSDKKWRKCPICFDAVHPGDLKSTSILQQRNFKNGEFITFHLMCRKQGSLFIEKVGSNNWANNIPSLTDESEQKNFSKFLLADPSDVLTIIERERTELLLENENSPEFVFIQQAISLLQDRELSILKDIEKTVRKSDEECQAISSKSSKNYTSFDLSENSEPTNSKTIVTTEEFDHVDANTETMDAKYYYFYQSIDGQSIYLHSMNVRMLQAMYGSLEHSPHELKGKIVQKETFSMSEEFRRRLRYLQHLPLTCQFEVIEISLESPVVSDEILMQFRDEITLRHKHRIKRVKEERKRERQINEINDRQMGKVLSTFSRVNIVSPKEFPSWDLDDFSPNNNSNGTAYTPSSSISETPCLVRQNEATPSFAKMLSSPQKKTWPGLENSNDRDSSSWKNIRVAQLEGENSKHEIYDVNAEEVHIVRHSLGDVLAVALEKKKVINSKNPVNKIAESNKKGKKNKKTLLFSTGMSYSTN